MDVTKAQKIVSRAISGRARWGKLYFCENNMEEVLDALIVLDDAMVLAVNHQDNLVEKEDLTKARRQVTAAKAREARQKKQIKKLEERIWALEGERDQLIERLGAQNEENTP
jgi:50S ribosomal subunit-associated GTPase HflX